MTKTFTLLAFLFSTLLFSQSEKFVIGKVLSDQAIISNIEIINFNSKIIAVTNELGEYKIAAKVNDELIILSDKYFNKTIVVSKRNLTENTIINLVERPIELDEVKVLKQQKLTPTVSYNDIVMARIAKENSGLRNDAVYTGVTTNGMDFVQIGKMIGKLFKKKKAKSKIVESFDFREYAKSNFSDEFFVKTLEIKPDEISLFLDFCEADPKAITAIKTNDEFTILDYLISKKTEFLKMLSENKK